MFIPLGSSQAGGRVNGSRGRVRVVELSGIEGTRVVYQLIV